MDKAGNNNLRTNCALIMNLLKKKKKKNASNSWNRLSISLKFEQATIPFVSTDYPWLSTAKNLTIFKQRIRRI